MSEKRYWFIGYFQETPRGTIHANAMLDLPPWEFAGKFRKEYNTPHGIVITFTTEVTKEDYDDWRDHF